MGSSWYTRLRAQHFQANRDLEVIHRQTAGDRGSADAVGAGKPFLLLAEVPDERTAAYLLRHR